MLLASLLTCNPNRMVKDIINFTILSAMVKDIVNFRILFSVYCYDAVHVCGRYVGGPPTHVHRVIAIYRK